jgi:hypothetical protein
MRLANPALAPFRPAFVFDAPDGAVRLTADPVAVSLYSVCCAELYNHVAEDAPYQSCANETCGRLFTRQVNRATKGQHHAQGVMYCSSECAHMQNQRNYRRRKAQRAVPARRKVEVG